MIRLYDIHSEPWHARQLARTMREADKQEVWATRHYTPLEALEKSVAHTPDPRTVLANGKIVCMFGVGRVTLLSTTGIPWMLGSDLVESHSIPFLRRSLDYRDAMLDIYTVLKNYVDERNVLAIRWLRWLGFTIEPAEPFGVEQRPFHAFHQERPNV